MMWRIVSRNIKTVPTLKRFELQLHTLAIRNLSIHTEMTEKYVEHESKRVSKRKRGMSHFKKKNKDANLPKLGQDDIDSTDYYFENGLRKVYPYFYPFSTFVKGRWIGRTVRDVFLKEFKGATSFEEDLENNLVSVNGKPVRGDWVLKTQQFLEHKTHRHENPVTAVPIDIIADTPDLLVINKPSSIPVHPCGRYRFNSLTMLLRKEYGYRNLRTLYRLDRLTSGVLLLPKTTAMSVKMEKQLAAKQLNKEYICRVVGEFPERQIECKEPLGVISIRMAVSGVRPDGKESHTTFTRLGYNGRSSVVKCIPHTGRTHQIRVHLQYLGYPILNDPVYNSTAFGEQKGKGGKVDKTVTELEQLLSRMHNSSEWIIGESLEYKQLFGSGQSNEAVSTNQAVNSKNDNATKPPLTDDSAMQIDSVEKPSVNAINESINGSDNTVEIEMTPSTNQEKLTENSGCKEAAETSNCDVDNSGDKTKTQASGENESLVVNLNNKEGKAEIEPGKDTVNTELEGNAVVSVIKNDDKKTGNGSEETNRSDEIKENTVTGEIDQLDSTKQDNPGITLVNAVEAAGGWEQYVAQNGFDKSKYVLERTCHMCRNDYKEPQPNELILFLHAVRYKGPGWEYSTPLPDWARDDWALEDQYKVDYDS